MVGAEAVSVTIAASGFQSYLACVGEAGEDAACAGLAGETSEEGSMPWAVAGQRFDAGYKAIAEVQVQRHMVCSTLTVASGWAAGRRLAFHAGRAVVIEQMQES